MMRANVVNKNGRGGQLRSQRSAVFPLLLAVSAALQVNSALADSLSPPASFDTRFSAAETTKDVNVAEPRPLLPTGPAARRGAYRALIDKEATGAGLSPDIAEAVMAVESGYNPAAVGGVGEIGLMQLLPSTARMLGFSGNLAELAAPETNIHYGVTYLAQAWRLAGGDLCTAVMKYRAGHGETRFSYRSVDYCLAVRSKLAARGIPVTGRVPVATFGEPGGGCGRRCLGASRIGHIDLAALNTQLSALVVQVRGGR